MRLSPNRVKPASSAPMPPLAHHWAVVLNHSRDRVVKCVRFFLIVRIIITTFSAALYWCVRRGSLSRLIERCSAISSGCVGVERAVPSRPRVSRRTGGLGEECHPKLEDHLAIGCVPGFLGAFDAPVAELHGGLHVAARPERFLLARAGVVYPLLDAPRIVHLFGKRILPGLSPAKSSTPPSNQGARVSSMARSRSIAWLHLSRSASLGPSRKPLPTLLDSRRRSLGRGEHMTQDL